MDKLKICAKAFEKLLHTQYKIIIGRKGKTVTLCITFSQWDFHHLMGLGKLKDLRVARKNRNVVFEEILSDQITYQIISKSRYIQQIENRFQPLSCIEQLLDDNHLIFRYNKNLNQFSLIEADYLLSSRSQEKQNEIYIFLTENKDDGTFFCRSFFPKEQKDYTQGQSIYTLLYKEKSNLLTGETIVQYDRLTPKNNAFTIKTTRLTGGLH